MICLEVKINGENICKAGVEHDFGIVHAIVDWVKRDVDLFPKDKQPTFIAEQMKLSVSGSATYGKDNSEELRWIKKNLSIGDEITIKIVEADTCDPPTSRKRLEPDFVEKAKRRYFEELKKKYDSS